MIRPLVFIFALLFTSLATPAPVHTVSLTGNPTYITSNSERDTIACRKAQDGKSCAGYGSPYQYAAYRGYKFVHKISVYFDVAGLEYIIMEVSK